MQRKIVTGLGAATLLCFGFGSARADFIVNTDFSKEKGVLLPDLHDVSLFIGNVGSPVGPIFSVLTVDSVDSASANATIAPVRDSTLTSAQFIMGIPGAGSFSFEGSLVSEGSITLTVQAYGQQPQSYSFGPFPANQDFGRIGVIATPGSGQFFLLATVTSAGFKEIKQAQFGPGQQAAPELDPGGLGSAVALLVGGVLALRGRRWRKHTF